MSQQDQLIQRMLDTIERLEEERGMLILQNAMLKTRLKKQEKNESTLSSYAFLTEEQKDTAFWTNQALISNCVPAM
jgi:hypothetical protein